MGTASNEVAVVADELLLLVADDVPRVVETVELADDTLELVAVVF